MSYNTLASDESIQKTALNLKEHNFEPVIVNSKEEALEKLKEIIPAGVTIMNGTSTTLAQIGFIDYLKSGQHNWNNLHDTILKEEDLAKQSLLRRQSVVSDYYAGSVHALTETGEIIIASNTGSQLAHSVYTTPNIIYVVGAQKIVPSIDEGLKRIEEHVVPLEDERMKSVYGFGTTYAKTLILRKENPNMGRNLTVIIVKEVLGF